MAQSVLVRKALVVFLLAIGVAFSISLNEELESEEDHAPLPPSVSDEDILNVVLNLEYLETEFFLFSAFGKGLDDFDPKLSGGGPPPIGGEKAIVSDDLHGLIELFALQEVGHVKALREYLGTYAIPRPLLNISRASIDALLAAALGKPVVVDPYFGDLDWILSAFTLPYVGLTGLVGALENLQKSETKRIVAGLLGIESGQDAVLRTLIYTARALSVPFLTDNVLAVASAIAKFRSKLDGSKVDKDPKLIVLPEQGAQHKTAVNILAGDEFSLSFPRSPRELFRVVYGTGNASRFGGFYPKGANGRLAAFYADNPADG